MEENEKKKREPKEVKVVKLLDDLVINIDTLNYQVVGSKYTGYASSFEGALKLALKYAVKNKLSGMQDLKETLEVIKSCKLDLVKAALERPESLIPKIVKEKDETINKELGFKLCKVIGTNNMSNGDIETIVDNVRYAFEEVEEMTWEDEGKYSCGEAIYQVGVADEETPWNIAEEKKMNLFIRQTANRCGSYFTDYTYNYDEPTVVVSEKVETTKWINVKKEDDSNE